MTRRVLVLTLAWMLGLMGIATAQPSPDSPPPAATRPSSSVTAAVEAKGDVFVGQRITLAVVLRTPGIFAGAPSFDLPRVPGLLLMPPTDRPVIGSETAGDVSFTTQQYELSVLSRRAGEQTIPAFTVRFGMKRSPLDRDSVEQSIATAPLKFAVKSPPGAEKLGAVLSAADLSLTESWNHEPGKAKPGDAFVRTITLRATGLPAMALPPIVLPDVPGVAIYPGTPDVTDSSNRGDLVGERRQSFTYVCQKPGTANLPAIRLQWFDLTEKALKSAELPKRTLDIVGPPAPATQPAAANDAESKTILAGMLIAAVVIGLVWWSGAWRIVPRVVNRFRPRRLAPLNP